MGESRGKKVIPKKLWEKERLLWGINYPEKEKGEDR